MNSKLKQLRDELAEKYGPKNAASDWNTNNLEIECFNAGFDAATDHILNRADQILMEALMSSGYYIAQKTLEQWRKEFEGEE